MSETWLRQPDPPTGGAFLCQQAAGHPRPAVVLGAAGMLFIYLLTYLPIITACDATGKGKEMDDPASRSLPIDRAESLLTST